jgi:hypothetical protein
MNQFIDHFTACFKPQRCQQLARATGFVKRQGKIQPFEFVYAMSLAQLSALHPSLSAQAQSYTEPVTRQAVDQRFRPPAVAFFQAAFQEVLHESLDSRPLHPAAQALRAHFHAVKVFDSTHLAWPDQLQELFPACGGGGAAAGLKVLLSYEYIQSQLQPLQLLPSKCSDQGLADALASRVGPEELALMDKGFFKGPALRAMDQQGGYFIIPWPRSVSVAERDATGQRHAVDLVGRLKSTPEASVEIPAVHLGQGASELGPVRLLAYRFREEVANRRRAALREKYRTQGRTPTAEALELAGWLILVTNAPAAWLPLPLGGSLYRLRWQIELVFKQFKSVLRLDWVPGANPYRLLCEVWGRLLAGLLLFFWHRHVNAICWATHQREISFAKLARHLQQQGQLLAWTLFRDADQWKQVLAQIWHMVMKLARKELQRSRKTTWEHLQQNLQDHGLAQTT